LNVISFRITKVYKIVNFRASGINRSARKLNRTPMIKKNHNYKIKMNKITRVKNLKKKKPFSSFPLLRCTFFVFWSCTFQNFHFRYETLFLLYFSAIKKDEINKKLSANWPKNRQSLCHVLLLMPPVHFSWLEILVVLVPCWPVKVLLLLLYIWVFGWVSYFN